MINNQSNITFVRCTIFNTQAHSSSFQHIEKKKEIFLLDPQYRFNIFEFLPRTFPISTKNGLYHFNINMIKYSCPVIGNFLKKNPNDSKYHIDIEDKDNIMEKFEDMYQGQIATFNSNELPVSREITKELQLTSCPNDIKQPIGAFFGTDIEKKLDFTVKIKIDDEKFKKYIQNDYPRTFVISTKRKEYHCNEVGVCSSKIIREFIKNNRFDYDFDDECNEFQTICDFFNFKKVKLTISNINSLKFFANDLQIDCILDDLNCLADEYEKISQTIDEQQKIIESIDELFSWLYHIKEEGVESLKEKIINSSWIKTEENVQELAAIILQVVGTDISFHPLLADLLVILNKEANEANKLNTLLPIIVKNVMLSFVRDNFNSSFIFNLYKREIIPKEDILSELEIEIIPKIADFNIDQAYLWFLPEMFEIPEFDEKIFSENTNKNISSFYKNYFPDKIEEFKLMRSSGEPNNAITKSLRIDDVDTLQTIVSSSDINIKKAVIPFNLFETFVQNGSTNYINYAAAYGSIKCFKYLLLNHAKVDESTFRLAVFGGNIEIIKIVYQQRQNVMNEISLSQLENQIIPSIMKHQNDLFDWILDEKFSNIDINWKLLITSVENGNAHSIIGLVDKGFNFAKLQEQQAKEIITVAAEKGFYKLLQLLFILMDKQLNQFSAMKIYDEESSIFFGNLSIFKLIFEKINDQNFLKNAFFDAVQRDHLNIVKYIFETYFVKQFDMTQNDILKSLKLSIKRNTSELFAYLLKSFQEVNPENFIDFIDQYNEILSKACANKNLEIVKIVTEIIFKENQNNDFSLDFYEAIISKSLEICQYFIDKHVNIEYDLFFTKIYDLASIGESFFLLLINTCPFETRDNFLSLYLSEAIQQKNKKLIEFILKENSFCDNALFEAVKTEDIDIVNMILNHNNKPSFINKRSIDGSALNVAVKKNNLYIVQKLLSLPGIDLNIYDNHNLTPFTSAVLNFNVEIMDEIIKFYESNKLSIVQQANNALKEICMLPGRTNLMLPALYRLIEIENIDLNLIGKNETVLIYACRINELNLVKKLLKNDKIDVNLYELSKGCTALMTSIKNKNVEIAKLLISYQQTNINIRNYADETALTLAVSLNLDEIVSLLINNERFDPEESRLNYAFTISKGVISTLLFAVKGLDVNCNVNDPPLINAVKNGNCKLVDLIIGHSTFNPFKSKLNEAIFLSIEKDNFDIFKKLISIDTFDIDINLKNNKGKSIFEEAVSHENQQMIQEILKNKKFDSAKSDILNAFMKQCLNNKHVPLEVMNDLCEYDKRHDNILDFKKILPDGKTFFTKITQNIDDDKMYDLITFLIDHGADPNVPDCQHIYPLEHAIYLNSVEFIRALIDSGKIDYSVRFSFKKTPLYGPNKIKIISNFQTNAKEKTYLHLAARSMNPEILKEFLNKNVIDVNVTDELGETPLMEACRSRANENVQLLFQRDDLNYLHCNNEGKDAIHILTPNDFDEDKQIKTKDEYCIKLLYLIQIGYSLESYKQNENDIMPVKKERRRNAFNIPDLKPHIFNNILQNDENNESEFSNFPKLPLPAPTPASSQMKQSDFDKLQNDMFLSILSSEISMPYQNAKALSAKLSSIARSFFSKK